MMKKIGDFEVDVFKVRNRRGYAALCEGCLTEGDTPEEAFDRMVKAVRRVEKKITKK